ncbi:hypothetical protein [uncultured Winogradskyella sp.]|uniref:hypothetical protein n=1 Tax=uncultured Winogradskyella sp. TaxID=395353 RepID=UPI0026199EB4|nr:hypothetical protein [uncultured Winogradskyella sp.]
MIKKLRFSKIILLFLFCISLGFSQSSDIIAENYSNYTDAPREVVYVHLNKSTYIEGEMLGFTAYVFDKFVKKPSLMTKNLYCTISDSKGNVLKKKLLKVDKGTVSNVFDIDSTLNTGVFTFKAYTNWMRNFNEANHFEQSFKVIDADNIKEIKPVLSEDLKIDLQVLGEGGHIFYKIPNTIGIIAKNQFGLGIKNVEGKIVDGKGTIITDFQLNNSGIAKAMINPDPNTNYFVEIKTNDRIIKKQLKDIKASGMSMGINTLGDNLIVRLKSNTLFYKQFGDGIFKIVLHDGSELKLTEFQLGKNGEIIIKYPKQELFTGINIFTVFNEQNKPILERLYFNMTGFDQGSLTNLDSQKTKDSIKLKGKFQKLEASKISNVSISVLPSGTKSYNHHNNILSQLFIQPYVRGYIENGAQYFENTRESNYNLDLLLLTQGWSSYDWNTILTQNNVFIHPFERGIDVVANINGKNPGNYVVYPLETSSSKLFEVKSSDKEFTAKTIFPNEDDLFRIGFIDAKNKGFRVKPSIYLQFYPSQFPKFSLTHNTVQELFLTPFKNTEELELSKSWADAELLDEVVVEASKTYTRAEQLKNKAINSRVEIIDDRIKLRNQRLDLYLQRLGFNTQFDYFSGNLSITNPRVQWGSPVPLVYLNDGFLSSDFTVLTFLNMQDIDYIEYELYGIGGGIRGQAGFIKIYTLNDYNNIVSKNDNVQTYDVPLRFSNNKKFYVSKYKFYNSTFYNEYGTIDWIPNVKLQEDGSFDFKVLNTKNSFKLFIEGMVNGKFVSEEILVDNF